jgi:putative tricarboxylic transport membrane protein
MDGIIAGFSVLGTQTYWIAFLTASLMATIAGLLPGISTTLLLALAIPFIVFTVQDPVVGIVMLATIAGIEEMLDVLPIVALGYAGGGQVTFIESRPLSARGQAARVLGFVYVVSAFGGFIGAIALLLVIPIIKPFILQFSFAEIGAVGLFGVAMVGALSRGAMLKGIASGVFGMLLSTVGLSVFTGEARYTFDFLQLREGLPLIATSVGLFALPELFDLMMTRKPLAPANANISTKEVWRGAGLALKYWRLIVRHSLLGVFMGAIPGVGSRVVSWLSYGIGISLAKNKHWFGKGSYKGLVFSESVQSAKEGGHAIPTLALGIPAGQAWVFILVAMLAYGISPGPQLLTQHGDIVSLIVISLVLGNAMLAIVGIFWSGTLAKMTRVPYPLLGAVIIPLVILSAFQETRHWSAIPFVLGFAILGLLMKQYKWPRPPLILGFILGHIVEENLLSAVSLYGVVGTLQRPLTIVLLVMAVVIAVFFARLSKTEKAASAKVADALNVQKLKRRPWTWSWVNLFPIFFILIAIFFISQALGFRPKAAAFPLFLGGLVIFVCLLQILETGWKGTGGEVLDLGMLSNGIEGQKQSAISLFLLIVGFLFLSMVIGLEYSAIVFATVAPLPFVENPRRSWPWCFLTGGLMAAFALFVFDHMLDVIWPDPVIGSWIVSFFE